jgi:hypothetical protein
MIHPVQLQSFANRMLDEIAAERHAQLPKPTVTTGDVPQEIRMLRAQMRTLRRRMEDLEMAARRGNAEERSSQGPPSHE